MKIRLPNSAAAIIATLVIASTGALSAYVLKGYAWPVRTVPYYVNAANLDIDPSEAEAAIRAGAETWATQSSAGIALTYAGTTTGSSIVNNGRNEVFFRNDSNGSAIATTYSWYSGSSIIDTDIVFWDAAFTFFSGTAGCSGGFYIEDVVAHEFGHALGLGHSADSTATMYASASYCSQSFRVLASDDIAGIESIYPAVATTPPTAPSELAATISTDNPASAVDIAWADGSTDEDRFLIERALAGGGWAQVASVGTNVTAYADQGLQSGTTYSYRVRAENSAGFSGYAGPASATTHAPVSPATPSSPTPATGATGVSVDIDPSWVSVGAQSYDVYFGTSAAPARYASGLTAARLVLPTLSAGTTYFWRVTATNETGSSTGPTWSFTTKAAKPRGKK